MLLLVHFVAGAAAGYLVATLLESVLHQCVSDAPLKTVKFWRRHPRLFKYLIRTHFSHHLIHHVKTFRQDHTTQFQSGEERQALDRILKRYGRHGQIIREAGYAVKLHSTGGLLFVSPLVPLAILAYLWCGAIFTCGAMLTMALPPIFSNYVHPYLHMSHKEAVARAPRWIAWLLRTRYGRAMSRAHFMHHRYEDCHFNLVLGGDLLRGKTRTPNSVDLAEMERIGIPST